MFDENVFPFSELHTNADARLRTDVESLPSLFPFDFRGTTVGDQSTNSPRELANDTVAVPVLEENAAPNTQEHAPSHVSPGAEHATDSPGPVAESSPGSPPPAAAMLSAPT